MGYLFAYMRNKTDFRVAAFLFVSTIMAACLSGCSQQKYSVSFDAMNTFMTITGYGRKSEAAVKKAQTRIYEIEELLSTTKEGSDIFRINEKAGETRETSVQAETAGLLAFARDMAFSSEGAFNPCLYSITKAWGFTTGQYTVPDSLLIQELLPGTDYTKLKVDSHDGECWVGTIPGMMLDLGAVGKGYAGDQAIKVLKENGITSALLDLGGNIQVLGTKTDGTEWNVGIRNPWDSTVCAGLKIADSAVVTSGGYERFFTADDGRKYIHIIDGTTGCPVESGLAAVTIVCESGLHADALSTAMFVKGLDGAAEYWRLHRDFEMIVITDGQDLYYTEGLEGRLSVIYSFSNVFVIR